MTYTYDTLDIWRFSEIINTKNYHLLYVGKKIVTPEKEIELYDLWSKIFYKYIDEKNDYQSKLNQQIIFDVAELEKDYKLIKNCLRLYNLKIKSTDKKRISIILKKKGLELNHKKNLPPQIDKIDEYLKILNMKISRKKLENEKLFKEDVKVVKRNIYRETILVGKVLDLRINPRKTVLPEWIELVRLSEEQSKKVA